MALKPTNAEEDHVDFDQLVKAGLLAVKQAWVTIDNFVRNDPVGAFETVQIGKQKKKALMVDVAAERAFKDTFINNKKKGLKSIEVHGEESLRNKDLNLEGRDGIFALADMVDGTDLLERGLANWCSAAIFFSPKGRRGQRILASFVALPSGKVYYATAKDKGVRFKYLRSLDQERSAKGTSGVRNLRKASVCFYGQKAKNFVALAKYPFFHHLATGGKSLEEFRLYTLAGIPMVVNLIDAKGETGRKIDAVFEVNGQKPHDVVPGAYLALKGGASVKNLATGRPMTLLDLEKTLLRPAADDSKIKYVIASTSSLSNELEQLLTAFNGCAAREACALSTLFPISQN